MPAPSLVSRRRFLESAAALVGLGLVGGCSQPAPPETRRSSEPVKVTFMSWGIPTAVEIRQGFARTFTERNPGVIAEFVHVPTNYWDKLQTMLAGGVPPDVFFMNSYFFTSYAAKGVLLALTPLVKRDNFDLSDFHPLALRNYTYRDVLYALPRDLDSRHIIYNVELFARSGLEPPPSDIKGPYWPFDRFLQTAQNLTLTDNQKRIVQYGVDIQTDFPYWISFVYTNGGDLFDESLTRVRLTEEPAVAALQYLQDLRFKHRVAPTPEALQEQSGLQMFYSGKVAMTMGGAWQVGDFRKFCKFEWDVALLPVGATGRPITGSGGVAWAVAAQSKHQEIAWRLCQFLTSKEAQETESRLGNTTPTRRSVARSPAFLDTQGKPPKHMATFIDAQDILRVPPQLVNWPEINQALVRELDYLWTGRRPAREVAQAIKQAIEPLLATGR